MLSDVTPYMYIGLKFAAIVLVCVYIGYKLDQYFDVLPLFILIFTFLGVGYGMYSLYRVVIELNEEDKSKNGKRGHR